MNPRPPPEYVAMQKELGQLLDTPYQVKSARKKELYDTMHKIFMAVWGFKKSDSYRYRHFSEWLDHTTCYRNSTGHLVLATQPYDFPYRFCQLRKDCGKIGAHIVAASEWAFYYPGAGHAGLAVIYLNRK